MTAQTIEIQLDVNTAQKLDRWRSENFPLLSRSDAARLFLEQNLQRGRQAKRTEPSPSIQRPSVDKLGALFALEQVSGFGPVKFREMHKAGIDPREAIDNPDLLPFAGKIGERLRSGVRNLSPSDLENTRNRAFDQIAKAQEYSSSILVHGDMAYPGHVFSSNNPVPILYARGDPSIWKNAGSVAIVGSRKIREPYASAAKRFAFVAAKKGMVVVSGFALGADSIGHAAAREVGGRTVCVMPCGLDHVFPPENRELWNLLMAYSKATFVSEFGFGLRASSLFLRKRNKLIVAFSQGVLVAQSADNGGAMNACRFGRDQKKPVATFKTDGTRDLSGNATIENETRSGSFVFKLNSTDRFEKWLEELSS